MRSAGLPVSVVGVVIALLVLMPEGMSAVRAARRGQVQTSLNLAYGSAMASIGLTIPAIAVASVWLSGPLILGLGAGQLVLLAMTVVVGGADGDARPRDAAAGRRAPVDLRCVPVPGGEPVSARRAWEWLGRHDPGYGALRRACRAALVMPLMFALGDVVIGDPALATFAAFGSFAMLLLVDFSGPMRRPAAGPGGARRSPVACSWSSARWRPGTLAGGRVDGGRRRSWCCSPGW